jgi:SAM-dependent methyltransferase
MRPPDFYHDRVPSHTPHERALRAVHDGGDDVQIRLRSSLGEDEDLPAAVFFREGDGLFPFERYALELCRGDVLDLGAGAGVHSLELQKSGTTVVAIENCRELVRIMEQRGVRNAIRADFRFWHGPRFDSVLLLMNGIGPVGTLAGLDRFLTHARRFLHPGGQLLVDSALAVEAFDAITGSAGTRGAWPDGGGYAGQAWIELEYDGLLGRPFRELYIDLETMSARAWSAGWNPDIAFEADGAYVVRLTPR